jgi:hypothetical protein
VLSAAVSTAPPLHRPVQWRLHVVSDRVELHAEPSRCPITDPIGRARTLAGGVALRNLELAVTSLDHRPVVQLLPDTGDPLHLATVLTGDRERPDAADQRLHRSIRLQQSHPRPFTAQPVAPQLSQRLVNAARRPGVHILPMAGDQLRTVGTVLAAAVNYRHNGEDHLADVESWLSEQQVRTPRTDRAVLIDQLSRGALMMIGTDGDLPSDWILAGWALQNAWLTAVGSGLVASVVGGVLDAPGVRGALIARLQLNCCPQLLLRIGWSQPRHADGW